MTDDCVGVVLIFFKELLGSGECNLIDIFVNILSSHADTMIGNGERSGLFVNADAHAHVAKLTLEIAERRQGSEFLRGIHSVRHKFTEKYLVVTVKKFLDYREYVLGCYSYSSGLCHFYL